MPKSSRGQAQIGGGYYGGGTYISIDSMPPGWDENRPYSGPADIEVCEDCGVWIVPKVEHECTPIPKGMFP